jgi:hypothetical protein
MAFTVQQICEAALRKIRVLRANQQFIAPSPEYQTCLDALNRIVDTLSGTPSFIYQVLRETFPLTGAASYTMGAGGNLNTVRPTKIRSGTTIQSQGTLPIDIVSPEDFESIIDRTVTGSFIDKLCCDYGFPLATLQVWPAVNGGNIALWSYKPLTAFVALTDTVNYPPAYTDMLVFMLALSVAPEFPGSVLDQTVPAEITAAQRAVASMNAVTVGTPLPPIPRQTGQVPPMETDNEQSKPQLQQR